MGERSSDDGQLLLTQHDAGDRQGIGGVALAGSPGLRDALLEAGAVVVIPTERMKQGEQLAFYKDGVGSPDEPAARRSTPDSSDKLETPTVDSGGGEVHGKSICTPADLDAALDRLERRPRLVTAADWPADADGLASAGLYAWWVDDTGAGQLSEGLGLELSAGRIYAGQAGATSWPSGKKSDTTLAARVGGNHLGGRIRGSTFRCTLAAMLAEELELDLVAPTLLTAGAEEDLTLWMWEHLSVAVHPVAQRDSLASLEEFLLIVLDPPFNLDHRPSTPIRSCVKELRRLSRMA